MTDWKVLVDWQGKGFFVDWANRTDAPNLLGVTGSYIGSLKYQITGGGSRTVGTATETTLMFQRGPDALQWQSSTNLSESIKLGSDGTNYDLAVAAGTYSVRVWVAAGAASHSVTVRLKNGGTTLATSGSVALTAPFSGILVWEEFILTGTLGSPGTLHIEVEKQVVVSLRNYWVAGLMVVTGTSTNLPDTFNTGTPSLYDDVTDECQAADWSHGFDKPYQSLAAVGKATLVMKDADRLFVPENSASPLYGEMRPRRGVKITGPIKFDDGDLPWWQPSPGPRVMWSGFVESFQVTAEGVNPVCVIACHDVRKLADGRKVTLPVQEDKTPSEVAELVIESLDLPQAQVTVPISNPTLEAPDIPKWYEEVLPLALDPASNDSDGEDAVRVLADCAGSVQGRVFFAARDPYSPFRFAFGTEWYGRSDVVVTIDESRFQSLRYKYGESLVNECVVVARKRKVSAATDKILYDLDGDTIDLEGGETTTIRARYKDVNLEDDKTVGGIDVYLEYTADAGVTATILNEAAGYAEIEIENSGAGSGSILTMKVRGKKVTSWGEIERRVRDEASIADFGLKAELLDYRLNTSKKIARRLAAYRVDRFGQPYGEVTSVTLKTMAPDGADDADLREAMLDATVGSPVRLKSARLGHDAYYVVIGEAHSVRDGLASWTTTWTVERQYPVFRFGDAVFGMLNAGHKLWWQ
jgi:hypothetical protein